MDPAQNPSPDTNAVAGLKADRRTDVQFDFALEDIIAGNRPEDNIGRQLEAIVDDVSGLPTQGKVELALLPVYETMLGEAYRQEGGEGQPPAPNRHHVRKYAEKVMQARKIRRTALMRAAGRSRPKPGSSNYSPVPQFMIIACLVLLIAVVVWLRL